MQIWHEGKSKIIMLIIKVALNKEMSLITTWTHNSFNAKKKNWYYNQIKLGLLSYLYSYQ